MALVHLATNLCDRILRDRAERPSLIGTFFNLRASRFPTVKEMGVVVTFRGDEGDPYSVSIREPDGNLILLSEDRIRGTGEAEHAFQLWTTTYAFEVEIAFKSPGVYAIVLSGDDFSHECSFGVFPAPAARDAQVVEEAENA